ncbi:MAG: hypothetical protein ACN4E2_05600 [Nitrospinota bacterium]
MANNSEQESNVKVEVFFPFHYKVVTSSQLELISEIKNHTTADRSKCRSVDYRKDQTDIEPSSKDSKSERLASEQLKVLNSIEEKLEQILNAREEEPKEADGFSEAVMVELSYSSAVILTAVALENSSSILILLDPPTYPPLKIEILAEVVKSSPDSTYPNRQINQLTFQAINSFDRESLINYIFKRQQEVIRMSRY